MLAINLLEDIDHQLEGTGRNSSPADPRRATADPSPATRLSHVRNDLVHRLEAYSHRIACNRVSPNTAAEFLSESIGTLKIFLIYQDHLDPSQTTHCFAERVFDITRALRITSSLTRLYKTFNEVETKNLVDLFNILSMQVGALAIHGGDDKMAHLSRARIGCIDTLLSTLPADETSVALRRILHALRVVDPECGCFACYSDAG
ncbi:hypothetical protein N7468_009255 [Penicillium chermesinum]|uniref:Uncharacterized protein n=1 Tax=Penicillium chermesinum TaxID=63820 RepID=A0A9W9NHF9_9EURO|nr:uncharacterized protein N7468_009255 [Penicillium chermesinum]KAJ5220051.1 hypothetical protein N7468_009255 [Penicillium chermesinum]KAJ6157504.1 hypothetical protein N7470_005096 [Penicillium chermesinum]